MKIKSITVFCGSAENCPEKYLAAAEKLGGVIARQGRRLIYGSGQCGLMGRVAKGAKEAGGVITGINVKRFASYLPYPGTDEFIMADTLPERKAALIARGDALIALPGGVGTLDELMEAYALIQAGIIEKPLGLLNVDHYFDDLLAMMRRALVDRFVSEKDFHRLLLSDDPEGLLARLDAFQA